MASKMGRPKVDNPRSVQTRIRMTKEESAMLSKCAKILGVSKTNVVIQGIKKVYDAIQK